MVVEALTRLDQLFSQPEPRVLVHCLAGQNRSPTIIWLYLRSLGVNADVAKSMIESASTRCRRWSSAAAECRDDRRHGRPTGWGGLRRSWLC